MKFLKKITKKNSGQVLSKNRFVHLKVDESSYKTDVSLRRKAIFDDASYRSKEKSHFFRSKNDEIEKKNSKRNSGQILSKSRYVDLKDE